MSLCRTSAVTIFHPTVAVLISWGLLNVEGLVIFNDCHILVTVIAAVVSSKTRDNNTVIRLVFIFMSEGI